MDWAAFSAVCSAVSSTVATVSVIILVRQVAEMQRTTHVQSFLAAANRLQDKNLIVARRKVYQLHDKPIADWSREDFEAAEDVCREYDVVGMMVQCKMLKQEIIIREWGETINRLWPIVSPIVYRYRKERNSPSLWDDFEHLGNEAARAARRSKKVLSQRGTVPSLSTASASSESKDETKAERLYGPGS